MPAQQKGRSMQKNRRAAIEELLEQNGFANVQELARRFDVTTETIRRDLEKLEQEGLVRKVRGGAVSIRQQTQNESAHDLRRKVNAAEKKAIASVAVSMIREGDTVILTPGTTTLAVASLLRSKRDVTVITNSLPIAMELAGSDGVNVFCLGGFLRSEDYSVAGPLSLDNLKIFNANILIMGIGGISPDHGVTDYRMDESSLIRTFLDRAGCVIGLADHSKFGKVLRCNICETRRLTHLITDSGTPREDWKVYEDAGVQVHVAEMTDPE